MKGGRPVSDVLWGTVPVVGSYNSQRLQALALGDTGIHRLSGSSWGQVLRLDWGQREIKILVIRWRLGGAELHDMEIRVCELVLCFAQAP